MDLKEVHLLGDEQETHWYYAAKSAALLGCLDGGPARHLLDVGAGNGFFARVLLKHPAIASATCVDPGYAEDHLESCEGKPIEFRREAGKCEPDLVLLMDVLEHVDDDLALLRQYVELAQPGARFVVSVPAWSWMWSGHDEFLGHRRRYTLPSLVALVQRAGLEPVKGFYFFGLVFPAAAALRLWRRVSGTSEPASDLRRHHPWLNAALRRACIAEATIAQRNRAFGLTAFAVGVKTGEREVRR